MGLLTAPLSLVRVPLRLTLKAWEFGLSTAAEGVRIGAELLGDERTPPTPDFAQRSEPGPADPSDVNGVAPDVVTPETDYVAPGPGEFGPAPDVLDAAADRVVDAPPRVPDELIPDHVDEDPVLVAEVAEEGAEDGAGAELHIDAPWEGYDRMTAGEIRDRLAAATTAEAAAVELYESTHKKRRSVIDAAARGVRG
jgi:hypothetical protein